MLEGTKVSEAKLADTGNGLAPAGEGWYVLNVADAVTVEHERFGLSCRVEGELEFPHFGINVRLLEPGQPNCYYHRESVQEAFLVLSGECIAIVEDEERTLRKGDFLYTPPGTAHVLVGAGEGPCVILMVGGRDPAIELEYPKSDVAARYGGSARETTPDPATAYADVGPRVPGPARVAW